jgi:protein-tyrosine phosphatase
MTARQPPFLNTLPHPAPGSPYRVVFVCTGNICRSPMAEVVTRAMADDAVLADGGVLGDRLIITSAGTGPWHEGEPMDERASAALRRAGYPSHSHIAHQVSAEQLRQSDLVVALDRRHQRTLRNLGTGPPTLALLRSFDPSSGAASDVPDPYYRDDAEFDACLAMIAEGCRGVVSAVASLWDDLASH